MKLTVVIKNEIEGVMQKITFIGLGKMGTAMATQLLQAGFSLTVYNRTREKALPLQALGAITADSLESAVSGSDIVVTSLIDDKALISISESILSHLKQGAIHVSTSTILPKTASNLEKLHNEKGCIYLASPVLGIPKAVSSKTATALCAGNQSAADKIKPLLDAFSAQVINLGETVSHANVLKICLNYTLIAAIELISELYTFAEKSGLDTAVVQETLHHVYSHPAVKNYIDKIHDRDFDNVNFDMKGGNKDINLFQEAFLSVGVTPDLANIIQNKFTQALATGMESKDWSAVSEIVRNRSGLD